MPQASGRRHASVHRRLVPVTAHASPAWRVLGTLATVALLGGASQAPAQPLPNNLGGQDRADAASQMILLAVQQGISSLPPTSGQSFVYEYAPRHGTFERRELLGPISFRTPFTIGRGRLSARVATSYFGASRTFAPLLYSFTDGSSSSYTQFGLSATARVGIVNVGATYGVSDALEVNVDVPLTIVDAHATQSFPISAGDASLPPGQAPIRPESSPERLTRFLEAGTLVMHEESFAARGYDFNDGTSVGMGRATIGVKYTLPVDWPIALAFAPEFFFPSPSEEEFAGSDSAAILPRLVAQYDFAQWLNLHVDVGYEYDSDVAQLRRLTWDTGVSLSRTNFMVDFGVSGSEFDAAIRWSPRKMRGAPTQAFPSGRELTAIGDNSLGTTYVNLLAGLKVRVTNATVLGGTVGVPVTSDGFRPDAIATIAFEAYF